MRVGVQRACATHVFITDVTHKESSEEKKRKRERKKTMHTDMPRKEREREREKENTHKKCTESITHPLSRRIFLQAVKGSG